MVKLRVRLASLKDDLSQPASGQPHRGFKVSGMWMLQRSLGNKALQRMLQDPEHVRSLMQGRARRPDAPIGQPGDRYEQEADRTADQVMSANVVSPDSQPAHNSTSTGALDSETQQFFESRFGHNFSNVRVHSDQNAADSARGLGARAYTQGENIYFAPGEYQPSTQKGRRLLAHELAHVVQQSRQSTHSRTVAASLSKAPGQAIQRKLIATGDTAGFVALANSIIAVQFEVLVSSAGEVTIRRTNVQGPPTPEAQQLVQVLQTVINDKNTVTIEFIHGVSSSRASDARVAVGSYPQSKIDLDDVSAFGTQASVGLGLGRTAGALLSHEITEQHRKQVFNEDFDPAHVHGEASESAAVGGVRGTMTTRQISSTTVEYNVPYTYPNGRIVDVTWDLVNGNVTNVRRRVRP